MKSFVKKKHIGLILEPSKENFDSGASTYGCAFMDEEDPTTYLYYTGAKDKKWSHAAIGLAVSKDGIKFRKLTELNPLIEGKKREFNSEYSLTPAVIRMNSYYYMFFAGATANSHRKIGVAYATDPQGPWEVIGVISKPEKYWEGNCIDLGPSIVKLSEVEILVFYSCCFPNAYILPIRDSLIHRLPVFLWRRSIGILKVKINSPRSIDVLKYQGNPLKHLNGPKGSPNEGIFCPGHFSLNNDHFLLPSMSTYSLGFPYSQYIGFVTDDNPYFENAKIVSVLIDGPTEKKDIIPNIKSEIALDTPSPIVKKDEIYLYYSVMDRHDGIWKTALSIVHLRT